MSDFDDPPAPGPLYDADRGLYYWVRADTDSGANPVAGVLPPDVYDRILILCRIRRWHVPAAAVALATVAAEDCGKSGLFSS